MESMSGGPFPTIRIVMSHKDYNLGRLGWVDS